MAVGGTLVVETGNVACGAPTRPEEPPPGDYVMVAVRDNGSGMTTEVLAKVFEPFFTTKEVGKGSGLGLSQVFGLAKQSGGGVRIDSIPGGGTSVEIYLPRSNLEPDCLGGSDHTVETQAPSDRHVLVVDDDNAVREVTAGILSQLGYRVIEAGSGGAALEVLDQHEDIDLLMLDFAMPGMNGAEVAREARARRPSLPILFVTGYADTAALPAPGEEGVLRKPFREDELAAKLRSVLGVA
jgi:CheY-like chemotaxis protein